MTVLHGRYHDGVTAAAHAVEVTVAADGLQIAGAGVDVFWRRQDIEVRAPSRTEWRLGSGAAPDARLMVAKSVETNAALGTLGVGKGDALRGWVLVGGLTAIGAAIVALAFIAIPMAAEPLARMTPASVESRFGDNITAQVRLVMRPCSGPNAAAARQALAPLVERLAAAADPAFPVSVDFVRTSAPNAFALPGGQVMITRGLLEALESPDALAGVLAHEIGHVKARDGMVALYRNAGLGILLELVTGGSGVAQQMVAVGGQLAELRYTRRQEDRADVMAIAMLRQAGHDPAGLAMAFESLKAAGDEDEALESRGKRLRLPEWLLSHPDLDRRIAQARAAATPARDITLSPAAWAVVRVACEGR